MSRKVQKNLYIYKETVNEIKEYADKNNTTSSEVIEMLWDTFKQAYSDKEEMLISGIKESLAPHYEDLQVSLQRAEENIKAVTVMMKKLLSMLTEENDFGCSSNISEETEKENTAYAVLRQIEENQKQLREVLEKL